MAPGYSPRDMRIGAGRSTFLGLAGAAAFVLFGVALIVGSRGGAGAKVIGVLTVVVFGSFLLLGLRMLRAGGLYVLTAAGILFPYRNWPMLPWSDVQATRIVKRRGHRYLAVDARDTDARVRHMKSGARAARASLRSGLALVTIPEQLSPISLEELQREIERRRTSPATTAVLADQGATILPVAAASVASAGADATPKTIRTVRNVAAANSLWLLASTVRHPAVATPRPVLLALAAAFLIGAAAIQLRRTLPGLVTIVAAAIVLVVVDLTVGTHIAVTSRVGYLFFPVCVLLVAMAAWPRQRRSPW